MGTWKLIIRSLVFFRRTHLPVLLGTAVCTAVLVGALVVGDSVPHSLRRIAEIRLGASEYAVVSQTRLFRSGLANELSRRLGVPVAPVLNVSGLAVHPDRDLRVGGVEILGVDRRFWAIGASSGEKESVGEQGSSEESSGVPGFDPGPGEAVVNERLARRLGVQVGEQIVIRLRRPEIIPAEMPFALEQEQTAAARVEVVGIAGDESFGRFSLSANQSSPFNLFVSLDWLSRLLDLPEDLEGGSDRTVRIGRSRANMLLIQEGSSADADAIGSQLQQVWTLSDIGLTVKVLPDSGTLELRSRRVFLEQALSRAALSVGNEPAGVFTYLVNTIGPARGEDPGSSAPEPARTPYSFVSAPGSPLVPADMEDDEILINDWLAEDLQLSPGDRLELEYYVLGPQQELGEARTAFTVRAILPIEGPAGDRELMPDFPGLAEVDSSFDWQPGIPIDLSRIRDKDELYWERYRGTPKAFVTLTAAQDIWANRFGNLTAVRYAAAGGAEQPGTQAGQLIAEQLLDALDPETLGIRINPVRQEGIRAGSGAVDFGQLFLGLSFFLLAAAVLLTALLHALGIEQRAEETGLLRALGFETRAIRRLRLAEGAVVAAAGGILGAALGILYNLALLRGLNTLWIDAVGVSSIEIYVKPSSLLVGALSGMVIALLTMWGLSARQARRSPAELQRLGRRARPNSAVYPLLFLIPGSLAAAAAIALVATGIGERGNPMGRFFAAGGLLLVALLLIGCFLLLRRRSSAAAAAISMPGIGLRGIARRSGRSIAVSGLLAFGIFIVFAVGANRLDLFVQTEDRSSGTGGFALYGETTLPIAGDLNEPIDRRRIGLPGGELEEVRFVPLRVHEGDDASCLNLNQVRNPRILAVRPEQLAERGAFSFVDHPPLREGESPWTLLDSSSAADTIPAIVDQTVLTWGLHKSLGHTLTYVDEQGRQFDVQIVASLENSVFQGSILVSERPFLDRYPSSTGTNVFLADAPAAASEELGGALRRALRDYGLELEPAARRLAEFNKVQNTYLSIFLMLGGLGLILGSFGMGLVVARNTLERRGELALLRAVGFGKALVRRLLLSEHLYLLGYGVASGLIAALVAVLPVIPQRGADLPVGFLAILTAAVAVNGLVWTTLSVAAATRGDLLPALRNE
jgi:putative ABC transport system permease protein